MPLNTNYIDQSIDTYKRTSYLAKKIRFECGPYTRKRRLLDGYSIAHTLTKNQYPWKMATTLQDFILEEVENAYERGIFIVSSRTINLKNKEIKSAVDLLSHFKAKEPEHFSPTLWYPKDTYKKAIEELRYCHDIALELGPYILRHARAAFAAGMKEAAIKVIH